jgi:hypothetical protein
MRGLLSLLTITIILLKLSGCGKDDGPGEVALTESEITTQLLTGASVDANVADFWSVTEVQVDNIDYTTTFSTFTIQFTDTGFTTSNDTVIFGDSGSWSFTSDDAQEIKLDNGLVISVRDLTETSLTMEFVLDDTIYGDEGGRDEAVGGTNIFIMNR